MTDTRKYDRVQGSGQSSEQVEIECLSNGLKVVLQEIPYVKTAAFGVFVRVGSCHETKETNGMSHIIEHMIFKGTKQKSAKELADAMAMLGDTVNAYTGKEYTAFYGVTVAEELTTMISLLSEMLFASAFDKEALSKEKAVICEEIDLYNNSPEDVVHELLQKRVWRGHPLSFQISGNKGVVRNTKREDLLAFFAKHYVPENIVVSIAGKFDKSRIVDLLEGAFCFDRTYLGKTGNRAERVAGHIRETLPAPDSRYRKCYEERDRAMAVYTRSFCQSPRDISQLHMNLALPSISYLDDQRHVATVFQSVFGGSNNSLLFQRIREERGLAYSVYSYGCPYQREGLMHIDAVSAPSQTEEIFRLILSCMEELRSKEVPEDTLRVHKSLLRTEAILSKESVLNRMEGNGRALLLRGRVVPEEEDLKRMEQVTSTELCAFAKQILQPEKMSICLVGELALAKKGLRTWYDRVQKD